MQFRVFFKVKVQIWDNFWVAKISNIFFWGGGLEIPDIFLGEG